MAFDPERILKVLARHNVDHIVVGGIGGVLHGSPMRTDDLDIVPALQHANMESLATALNELGARILSHESPEGITVDWDAKSLQRWIVDFRFLNLQTDYGQLDLIHRPSGTSGYQDLAGKAEVLDVGNMRVQVAALLDIIRSKQAVARQRDLEQLPTLRILLESKKGDIRKGQEVIVPWELEEKRGTVLEILGAGPLARAKVRLHVGGNEEDLLFPVRQLKPAEASGQRDHADQDDPR